VRTLLTPGEGPFCEDFFTVSFYMPREYQVGNETRCKQCRGKVEAMPQ
jgi:hypothetical protein